MPRTITALTATANVLLTLLSPIATVAAVTKFATDRVHDRLDDESGASDLVVVGLITGIAAIIVVAYMAIVRSKALDEANNIPSSGG